MKLIKHDQLEKTRLYNASVFAVQNRYLGVRHNIEESGTFEPLRGTFINGFYDEFPIVYGEMAFGFPTINESMVAVPDAQTILIKTAHGYLNWETARVINNTRTFDLETGLVSRKTTYDHPKGGLFTVETTRFASAEHPNCFSNKLTVTADTYKGPLELISTLSQSLPHGSSDDPRAGLEGHQALNVVNVSSLSDQQTVVYQTHQTALYLGVSVHHVPAASWTQKGLDFEATLSFECDPNTPITLEKITGYTFDASLEKVTEDLKPIRQHLNKGFDALLDAHQIAFKRWRQNGHVQIETEDETLSLAVDYNLVQLLTAGAHDDTVSIAAKGLTGHGYHGHTFWDTEMYMFPYFLMHEPEKAFALLNYRKRQLPAAFKEAKVLGARRGAKFAWRTITGKETSAYYAAGAAQYHINSAVAYAVMQCYDLHPDEDWMTSTGFPILLETARFFAEMIHDDGTACHLHQVTGPDEYTAVVNNNFYTNQMIVHQMAYLLDYLKTHPKAYEKLGDVFISAPDEHALFERIANTLVLPHDATLNIDVQDDSFLDKKPWDFASEVEGKRPLLLHHHPLTIYRHQVLKQADTVLAHFLLQNRPDDVLENSYRYYLEKTTHDSSLSKCIYAGMAARLNKLDEAQALYESTLHIDLDNAHHNTVQGLHLANLGGVHLGLWMGFLGLQIRKTLTFNPHWPQGWKTFKGQLMFAKKEILSIEIKDRTVLFSSTKPIQIKVYDRNYSIDSTLTSVSIKG